MIDKVKWLEEEIMEEIQGAKAYMKCSKEWESVDGEIAKTFKHMAQQEMTHAEELNKIVTRIFRTHLHEMDTKSFADLMETINHDQIKEAKNYIPEADPVVMPTQTVKT